MPEKAPMLGCDRQMVQKEMCSASVLLCEGMYYVHVHNMPAGPPTLLATYDLGIYVRVGSLVGLNMQTIENLYLGYRLTTY